MQKVINAAPVLPAASAHYQYSLVNDVLFTWLRFYKATQQPHTPIGQRQYFYQKTVDAHHIAVQIPDFKKALLAKKTQLTIGQLSFLIYSALSKQQVTQDDISQWLSLGEVDAAETCLGFWLGYFISTGKCLHLPAELWLSDIAWIRQGVIKGLYSVKGLSEAWATLALEDTHDAVRSEAIRGSVNLHLQPLLKSVPHNAVEPLALYQTIRLRVLTGTGLDSTALDDADSRVLQACLADSPDALSLLLLSLPAEQRYAWLLSHKAELNYRSFWLGVGLTGDVNAIPLILAALQDESQHRLAAQAFIAITGFDLTNPEHIQAGWDGVTAQSYEKADRRKDEVYPWANTEALLAWWQAQQHRFDVNLYYVQGEPFAQVVAQDRLSLDTPLYIAQHIRLAQYIAAKRVIYDWDLVAEVGQL